MRGEVAGRLFWDEQHPSPWVSFRHITEYQTWARDIRRVRPRTRTEFHYVDGTHNAASLLAIATSKGYTDRDGAIVATTTDVRIGTEMRLGQVTAGMSRADRLRARRDEIEEELARLESLPEEPEVVDEDEDPCVIWFIKRFSNGRDYTYTAVRANDGLWYTSGPSAPQGYPWEWLIEWILSDGDEDTQVWFATEWEPL